MLIVYSQKFLADRNSESESVTNEDSSDNQIGGSHSTHNNTTISHDAASNALNCSLTKSTGKMPNDNHIGGNCKLFLFRYTPTSVWSSFPLHRYLIVNKMCISIAFLFVTSF